MAPVQRWKKEVPDDVAAVGDPCTLCTVVRLSLARVRLRRAALRFAGWLRAHRRRCFVFNLVVDVTVAPRGRPRQVSASMSIVWQCCANRSTSAVMQAALGKTCAHSL
jgi:hypothetical protein